MKHIKLLMSIMISSFLFAIVHASDSLDYLRELDAKLQVEDAQQAIESQNQSKLSSLENLKKLRNKLSAKADYLSSLKRADESMEDFADRMDRGYTLDQKVSELDQLIRKYEIFARQEQEEEK